MSARVGIVTGRRTEVNRESGGPAVRLLQVQITDHNDVQTVQLVGQAGEEVNPPNGSLVLLLPAGQGFKLAAGTDDGVVPIMDIGGKRLYAVNPTTAEVICDIQLKPDGTAIVANGAASFTMSPAGVFTFHGTASNFDHTVTAPNLVGTIAVTAPSVIGSVDVSFAGKSVLNHKHSGVQTGAGQTGVPV